MFISLSVLLLLLLLLLVVVVGIKISQLEESVQTYVTTFLKLFFFFYPLHPVLKK